PDPARWYRALERVEYDIRTDEAASWEEVAGWLEAESQALVVVNRKQDAMALLDALQVLGVGDAIHLSTLLCGAHRRDVLAEIHRRLEHGERCIVVSTQVVEAGVDLDFSAV